jgi:hypothetical protein
VKSELILSVCLCFSLIIPSISFGLAFQNYKNFSEGIQISYPSNWIYSEGKQPLPPSVFFVPENESNLEKPQIEQTVFLLVAHDTRGGYSNIPLDSYLERSLTQLHERSVNVNMTNKTVIAGIPAYQLFFTNPNGNRVELTITVHNGSPYAISYNSSPDKYDLYLPTVQKMLSTLKFI